MRSSILRNDRPMSKEIKPCKSRWTYADHKEYMARKQHDGLKQVTVWVPNSKVDEIKRIALNMRVMFESVNKENNYNDINS